MIYIIFLIVSAVCCIIGFKKTVYFLSVGYGFSVAGLGIAFIAAINAGGYDHGILTMIQCLLFIAYGARLSGFLIYRELKSKSYQSILKNARGGQERTVSPLLQAVIWAGVSVLYVLQTCPVFFRAVNGYGREIAFPLAGITISLAGLCIETAADLQKNSFKKTSPDKPAMRGLYRIVRCPNFFGEVLFWTGVFVGGADALRGAVQWIMAVSGYIIILTVMVNSTQRLDRSQEKRYGKDPEYRSYADRTPILIPLVPVCHIGRYKDDE